MCRGLNRADGLEIYISQSAKPGLGSQLMAKKVTPELARIRGIPHGIDQRSPSRHPDILGGGAGDRLIGAGTHVSARRSRPPWADAHPLHARRAALASMTSVSSRNVIAIGLSNRTPKSDL